MNLHIPTFRFRMTTFSTVRETLRPHWFLASIGLKDAYWHVPIHKASRPYLAFSAGFQEFQFRVLPLGLNIAPRVLTKTLRPVHARLASEGVNILMYPDDWLVLPPMRRHGSTHPYSRFGDRSLIRFREVLPPTYAVHSVARDDVGHHELVPSSPATTS